MSVPRTTGKCVIYTTKGDLEVELWAKECPLTSKYFIKCCLGNTFNGGVLNDYVKDKYIGFVYPNGTEGSAIAAEPNSRLKVIRDGMLCWNVKSNTWIITTSSWQNYYNNDVTVFGKIVGDSIYKLRELIRSEFDPTSNESKFLYPASVKSIEVSISYFDEFKNFKRYRSDESNKVASTIKKKVKVPAKVKISYDFGSDEDDDSDENDLIGSSKGDKNIRMKVSPLIKFKQKKDTEKISLNDEESTIVSKEESTNEEIEIPGAISETEPETQVKVESLTEREQATMKMLEDYNLNIKGKNILSRFSD